MLCKTELDQVTDECKYVEEERSQQMEINLFVPEQNKFKYNMVGVNSHLEKSIKEETLNLSHLWLADYVKATDDGSDLLARVTVYCKKVQIKETLRQQFIDSKMDGHLLKREECATHLVEQVVYGTEFLCLMQRIIDPKRESKETVQESVYQAAKTYINKITDLNSTDTTEPPVELNNVTCTIFSSHEASAECSVEELSQKLRYNIISENVPEKFRPIEILLHHIPYHFETRIFTEKKKDFILDIERNWNLVVEEECKLSNSPSVDRVPPLKNAIWQFHNLLDPLKKKINKLCTKITIDIEEQEKVLKDMEFIVQLLYDMNNWLVHRRSEIEALCCLLKDTWLTMLEWTEIEKSLTSSKRRATVFVLRIDYVADSLMEKIKSKINNVNPNLMLPVFPIVSDEKRLAKVSELFDEFANKAGQNLDSNCCFIGLMPSALLLADGDIQEIEYTSDTNKNKLTIRPITETADHSNDVDEWEEIQEEEIEGENDGIYSNRFVKNLPLTNQPYLNPYNLEGHDTEKLEHKSQSAESCDRQDRRDERIAEIFATGKEYSQVIKQGQPNVHLLEAKKTSTSAHLRRFEIGRPNTVSTPDHKVIILMGATGSGKSTLLDGMVNYILGVQWNDSFRFKIIREDESESRNQAHSQTSSVTAYTIYHQEGMAVPYSITLIDTPGYGDTRGVARDKEITQLIHRFLSQQDIQLEKIHAACFVAASGDSRLTVTQRYIIDSVLATFGKDFKDNIRLLVTFADNADPPVAEACRVGNFPVTSSADIVYSKFNSSVLYASNEQQGEEDFSFDQLFWDMGQENFEKFFKMLEEMDGRDLKSTREVIQHRDQLEQSLKDIEREIEVYLFNIENMSLFLGKMQMLGHKIETDENIVVEKPEMKFVETYCKEDYWAYNCRQCNRTCEKPKHINNIREGNCSNELCGCPSHRHSFQNFEWTQRVVKATKTFEEIKAKYELNCQEKLTTQQFLVECSRELSWTKAKLLSLLAKVGATTKLINSTAMRSSNALSPADYLSLMRSRVAEEQKPGYLTRLETLTELQQSLTDIGYHQLPSDAINAPSQWQLLDLPNVSNLWTKVSKYVQNYY